MQKSPALLAEGASGRGEETAATWWRYPTEKQQGVCTASLHQLYFYIFLCLLCLMMMIWWALSMSICSQITLACFPYYCSDYLHKLAIFFLALINLPSSSFARTICSKPHVLIKIMPFVLHLISQSMVVLCFARVSYIHRCSALQGRKT